jgi:hypothetical protein
MKSELRLPKEQGEPQMDIYNRNKYSVVTLLATNESCYQASGLRIHTETLHIFAIE